MDADLRRGLTMHIAATHDPGTSQHMRALERANDVRIARAALKRRVARGELDVREVILRRPPEADSMSLYSLLMSQPRWGVKRCLKLLALLRLSDRKRLDSLTERQCGALAAMLPRSERT
jgi:hypothetical protein